MCCAINLHLRNPQCYLSVADANNKRYRNCSCFSPFLYLNRSPCLLFYFPNYDVWLVTCVPLASTTTTRFSVIDATIGDSALVNAINRSFSRLRPIFFATSPPAEVFFVYIVKFGEAVAPVALTFATRRASDDDDRFPLAAICRVLYYVRTERVQRTKKSPQCRPTSK